MSHSWFAYSSLWSFSTQLSFYYRLVEITYRLSVFTLLFMQFCYDVSRQVFCNDSSCLRFIRNLWSFIILEKFRAPFLQIFSLPFFLSSSSGIPTGHGTQKLSDFIFHSLKLCNRHYQLVNLIVIPNLTIPCRLPDKENGEYKLLTFSNSLAAGVAT